MASWGKVDQFEDAPLWALAYVNRAPVLTNMGPIDSAAVEFLFENAEADDFITGVTVGLFNFTSGQILAGTHQGWVLKRIGSGGRSGRITGETLVCLTSNA
jgi:hypothetical protein